MLRLLFCISWKKRAKTRVFFLCSPSIFSKMTGQSPGARSLRARLGELENFSPLIACGNLSPPLRSGGLFRCGEGGGRPMVAPTVKIDVR